jgi:hypothetical protein
MSLAPASRHQTEAPVLHELRATPARDEAGKVVGQRLSIPVPFSVPILGSGPDDTMVVRSLELVSIEPARARLSLVLEMTRSESDSVYVSVGFFDEHRHFAMAHSFFAERGPTVSGVYRQLQAGELQLEDMDGKRVRLTGRAELFVHHTFLYDQGTAGIMPLRHVQVRVFHLLSG